MKLSFNPFNDKEYKPSIRQNYFYSLLRTFTGLLFPLITYPYSARILLEVGIGKVNYAYSVIGYFLLFSLFGLPYYGAREVAKVRNNRIELTRLVHELAFINIIVMLLVYIAFFIVISLLPGLYKERSLFIVTSLAIILAPMGLEWLFQGLEYFAYITLRTIIFRIAALGLMLLMVKHGEDYVSMAFVTLIATYGGNILNFVYAPKLIGVVPVGNYHPMRHFSPLVTVFLMNLITSLYVNMDILILGATSSMAEVGYYSIALRFDKLCLSMLTSLGSVLTPRLSFLHHELMYDEYQNLVKRTIAFFFFLGFPIIGAIIVFSEPIIRLLAGQRFLPSIPLLRALSPLILIIALSDIIGSKILYTKGKDKIVLLSYIFGAIVGVPLFLILIPQFKGNGAAAATLAAESTVLIVQIIIGKSQIPSGIITRKSLYYPIASAIAAIFSGLLVLIKPFGLWPSFFIGTLVFTILYIISLNLLGETFALVPIKTAFRKMLLYFGERGK